jgi:hypothetical protein
MSSLSIVLAFLLLSTLMGYIFFPFTFMVKASGSLCRGVKPYSIHVIGLSLSLEKASLMFSIKISFFKQSLLIRNQKATKNFKGVILAFLPVGAKSQHEHVEWCSQIHQDQLNEFSIFLLIIISTFSQYLLEFLHTHQIVLYYVKGTTIERDQLFLQLNDMAFIDYVEQRLQLLP